ncbi:MAG: hypothetical protein K2I71_01715 [Helicobacter sp.]|nr:hypothetical protein [Helicobacter sp.]
METNVWLGLEQRKVLNDLVFDAIQENLKRLIIRIDLRNIAGKEVCVIVFNHPLALQEWKREQSPTIKKMRELYKQRNLKDLLVFHRVLVEVSYKPQNVKKEKESLQTYKEQSSGDFAITAKDKEIKACFEAIKAAIKANLTKESQCKN